MDSSELLRQQLAKQIDCARNGVAIGPTGPTGPLGPTGPAGGSDIPKIFTIYIDYSTPNTISRLYIPRYLFGTSADPILRAGGTFTANVGTDLTFLGTDTITMNNTTHAFPIGLSGTGYSVAAYWIPSASSYLGGANLRWQNTDDNTLNLIGVTASRLNGANVSVRPSAGVTAGWLATLTIYYL